MFGYNENYIFNIPVDFLNCPFLFFYKDLHANSNEVGLKSTYNDVISSVEDFFDQLDPSTATQMEEACGLQG